MKPKWPKQGSFHTMDSKRLNYLDSIRGIAASIVLLYHCWLGYQTAYLNGGLAAALASVPNFLQFTLDKLLVGRAAVLIFFLLSGFVLTYSLHSRPMSYGGFVIKRLFRIYPVFLFVVISSFILHWLIGVRHGVSSEWLAKEIIHPDLSLLALAEHLVFWGTLRGDSLDGALWSLVHEMRISLLFPFIVASVRRHGWLAVAAYGSFSLACSTLSLYTTGQISAGNAETTFGASLLATGFFMVFFAVGAMLAIKRERIATQIAAAPQWAKLFLFVVVILCLMKGHRDMSRLTGILTDTITGIGVFGIIVLALGVREFRLILNHRLPIWLGRISYSLYLVHMPIIYLVNQTIGGPSLDAGSCILVIGLSLLAAELMARQIEFPSIRAGKKLCGDFVTV